MIPYKHTVIFLKRWLSFNSCYSLAILMSWSKQSPALPVENLCAYQQSVQNRAIGMHPIRGWAYRRDTWQENEIGSFGPEKWDVHWTTAKWTVKQIFEPQLSHQAHKRMQVMFRLKCNTESAFQKFQREQYIRQVHPSRAKPAPGQVIHVSCAFHPRGRLRRAECEVLVLHIWNLANPEFPLLGISEREGSRDWKRFCLKLPQLAITE